VQISRSLAWQGLGDETDFQFFASWRRFAAWQVGKFAGCFFMENFPTEIE
jgi:hypothetical protein